MHLRCHVGRLGAAVPNSPRDWHKSDNIYKCWVNIGVCYHSEVLDFLITATKWTKFVCGRASPEEFTTLPQTLPHFLPLKRLNLRAVPVRTGDSDVDQQCINVAHHVTIANITCCMQTDSETCFPLAYSILSSLLCPRRQRVGHNALMAVVSLSVCLSVFLTLSREWMDVAISKLAGRKPWPHLEVERSKVKVNRSLNAVPENQPYLRNGKACKSPFAWVEACCGGCITGCTACRFNLQL